MKFTLDVDSANKLVKYAKAYVDSNNPRELYRMVKIEIDGKSISATMLTGVSAVVCRFHAASEDSDHGIMFIRPPLTLFKKADGYVTIEDTEKETVYTTASKTSIALPKINGDYSSFIQTDRFFEGNSLATVYVDGDLLARSIACMGRCMRVNLLGEKKGVRLTSREGDAIILPIHPDTARKDFE